MFIVSVSYILPKNKNPKKILLRHDGRHEGWEEKERQLADKSINGMAW